MTEHGVARGQVVAPSLGRYPIPPLDLTVPTAPKRPRSAPPARPAVPAGVAPAGTDSPGGTDVVS